MPEPRKQSAAKRRALMERQKDHDEALTGERPEIVLDATAENAGWIRNSSFWTARNDER